jgi:uncharacterized protein (TIGR02231 family)
LRVVGQGASVQMPLPAAADVRGDGVPVRLPVSRLRLAAALAVRAVPKMSPFVFRVAEAVNGGRAPLLAGPVEIFRGGSFVARQTLPFVPSGGRFTLGFGAEERIRVRRIVVEETERETGLFGGSRHHRFAYRLDLESHLPAPEDVDVVEHVPVSELEDVRVVLEARTTAGHDLDRADGIVRWRRRLRPGERAGLDLAFRIEVPSGYE